MSWKQATFSGYKERLEGVVEKLREVENIQIKSTSDKLKNILNICESLKKVEEFKKIDKSKLIARIIE